MLSIVKRESALKGDRVADVSPVWVLLFGVFCFVFKKDSTVEQSNYKAVSLLYVPTKPIEMIIKLFVGVCLHVFLT